MTSAEIQQCIDRAAASFDDADFVHALARDALLERLAPVVVDAAIVVDLGSATGSSLQPLRKRFRRARLFAVDASRAMLQRAREKRSWFDRYTYLQADACALPFADHSVDVVFANLLLPFVSDPDRLFSEVARVLRKGGLFAFSTLGPDSLPELRAAWGKTQDSPGDARRFADMHTIGDAAVKAGLGDPVLDVDRTTISFASAEALARDLQALGAPGQWVDSVTAHAAEPVPLQFGLELVYGHCWGLGRSAGQPDVRIEANKIGRRRH